MDECLILVDECLILVDECLELVSECLILVSKCLELVSECLILVSECLGLVDECLILVSEFQNSMQYPDIVEAHNCRLLRIPNVFAAGFTSGFCFLSLRICEHGMVTQLVTGSFEPYLPTTSPQAHSIVITATNNHLPIRAKRN